MEAQKPDILFIVNPNAGKRNIRKLLRKLKKWQSKIDVQISRSPGHCTKIIHSELNNYTTFVAAGGDGTVNEVASALYGSNKKMAVYPVGSGNGFAREFGFNKNIDSLIKHIEQGKSLPTDVLFLNGHLSIHLSGVGYDSAVAHYFDQRKGRGFWNYVVSTICVILNYKPIEVTIQYDNKTITGSFFMINIANNRQFGFNACIAPNANPTDGSFELVLVSPLSFWSFPLFSFKLFMGNLKPSKKMKIISCKKEVMLTSSETKFHIDGEPATFNSPVIIKIEPAKLLVVDTGKTKFKQPYE